MIENEKGENVTEKELANETETERGIAEGPTAAIKTEDKRNTEAVAKTDRTEIAAETVIATEIDIETGK